MEKFIEKSRSIPTKDFNILCKIKLDTYDYWGEGKKSEAYYWEISIYRKKIEENYVLFRSLNYPKIEKVKSLIDAYIKCNFII